MGDKQKPEILVEVAHTHHFTNIEIDPTLPSSLHTFSNDPQSYIPSPDDHSNDDYFFELVLFMDTDAYSCGHGIDTIIRQFETSRPSQTNRNSHFTFKLPTHKNKHNRTLVTSQKPYEFMDIGTSRCIDPHGSTHGDKYGIDPPQIDFNKNQYLYAK